jgi:DNA-binding beta-propeller fold protein YncE
MVLDLSRSLAQSALRPVRFASLTVVAFVAVSLAGFVACGEAFPALPAVASDAGLTGGQLEAQPPSIIAEGARVNASSASVAYDPFRRAVWTANGDVGTISYVDPISRAVVQELPVGKDIRGIAVSPDGAWVAAVDRAGGTVSLIDAVARVVRATIAVGSHPHACVWDAANPRWLYVTEEDAGAVAVVDRTLGQVVDTLSVGRVPAGLAVSATRREVYVSHRIDQDVTVIDLHDRSIAADIPLADEPFVDPATPNGKPLGFEAPVLTADGSIAWVPHELLSTTHPFVFNQLIFPTISVVDIIDRVEVATDPNSNDIAGRKNLFAAINLFGANGQPSIFSQPCAVSLHPNGHVAWALMCGSQDLVTFTVDHGIATDAVRALPCDHPSGMTLDDTGARIFVVCDQSKQLLTFDTAGGDPVGITQLYGSPIAVAVDTVKARDPELRAGLTLFYQANSAKGALATTGNDWMSCAACHLDGFGTTNKRLFEVLAPPPNEAVDAEIGHIGLADNFSTAVQVGTPSFNPHDILSALLDQGGLSPDRTGVDRTGQVDPSSPPADAVAMAQGLALVIAADLPQQPTWLHNSGGAPDTAYDGAWCGKCHAAEYQAWSESVHAYAAKDPMMLFCLKTEEGLAGPQYSRLCAGCHDPVTTRTGDTTVTSGRGITCLGCHDVTALTQAGGNADLQAEAHDWTQDHKAWASASLAVLRQPQFCGGCHSQFVPGTGLGGITTLDEWETSPFAPATPCVDCHMAPVSSGGKDHHFPGGNVFMGNFIAQAAPPAQQADASVSATLLAGETYNLQHTVKMQAHTVSGGVVVTIGNAGAGHWFPTGVTDIREPWVELQAMDGMGNVLAHLGGPASPTDLLPPGAARLGTDIAQADGTLLLLHQLSLVTRMPFDVRVPSGEDQTFFISTAQMPASTASLDAVLLYRNVRTTFYRAATGDDAGAAPTTEMARVPVTSQ